MRRLAIVVVSAVLGAGLGAGAMAVALSGGGGTGPQVTPFGAQLDTLPPGPVRVSTQTIHLGSGFTSHHLHGGPTINLVRSGTVEITDPAGVHRYGAGATFVEPADRVHTIRIIDAVRIDVIRLLPLGAKATTEVPESTRP